MKSTLLALVLLSSFLHAQVGIIRAGCPSFPGFSATGGGAPRVGNAGFRIAPLPPCQSGELSLHLLGILPTTRLNLSPPLACEAGCVAVGLPLIIRVGTNSSFPAPIPNDPNLIGTEVWYQRSCQRPLDPALPNCVVMNGGLSIKIMP